MPVSANHAILTGDAGIIDSADATALRTAFDTMKNKHEAWVAAGNTKRRIVVFAHGGLTGKADALDYLNFTADWWLANQIYPFYFIWQSDPASTWLDMLEDEWKQRTAIRHDAAMAKSVIQHLMNTVTQDLVRNFAPVKNLWAEMKQNARGLSQPSNAGSVKGGLLLASQLQTYCAEFANTEIHLVGHSAGSIVHASLINAMVSLGIKVSSLSYLAPAIRCDEFISGAFEHIQNKDVKNFAMYCLGQDLELADVCAKDGFTAYYGSLLWLVSRGFEWTQGGTDHTPILGMQYFLQQTATIATQPTLEQLITKADGNIFYSQSTHTEATSHGGYARDKETMDSVLTSIVGAANVKQGFPSQPAAAK